MYRGKSISTVAGISGGIQTVYLIVSTLPKGVSVSWSANPVTDSFGGVKDKVALHVSGQTPRGTYTITVYAIGADGNKAAATYVLTVK